MRWKFKAECWSFSGLLNQSATSGEVVRNCSVTWEKEALSHSPVSSGQARLLPPSCPLLTLQLQLLQWLQEKSIIILKAAHAECTVAVKSFVRSVRPSHCWCLNKNAPKHIQSMPDQSWKEGEVERFLSNYFAFSLSCFFHQSWEFSWRSF